MSDNSALVESMLRLDVTSAESYHWWLCVHSTPNSYESATEHNGYAWHWFEPFAKLMPACHAAADRRVTERLKRAGNFNLWEVCEVCADEFVSRRVLRYGH